jgi:hypothetical protein
LEKGKDKLLIHSINFINVEEEKHNMSDGTIDCGSGNKYSGNTHLRVGGIFVILATSMLGVTFPIIMHKLMRKKDGKMAAWAYDFAKYFGSGVIIATAFIHVSTIASNLSCEVYAMFY